MNFYQHLPEYVNPIAFHIGNFGIRWYSLMYLAGFIIVYILLKFRNKIFKFPEYALIDFLIYSFIGLIVGARLGQVFFYDLGYYLKNPLLIVSPFDSGGNFTGIYGLSYFGGVVGILAASLIFTRRNNLKFFEWAEFVIPAIPAGYFFGRIGNFLNGELYGKSTHFLIGMHFPMGDGAILYHPTQLYEAFLEGILLFIILWIFAKKSILSGYLMPIYLLGYGIIRFFIEFLREPEGKIFFGLTTGQILSSIMVFSAFLLLFYLKRKKSHPISL